MKLSKIIVMVGYAALAVGVLMDVWNYFAEREVFSDIVTIPFYAVALIGIAYESSRIKKEKNRNKK